MGGGEGLHGRPRPVPLAHILGKHDSTPPGDPQGPPISIKLRTSPSVSVGARGVWALVFARVLFPSLTSSGNIMTPPQRATTKPPTTPHPPPPPLPSTRPPPPLPPLAC